MAKRSITETSPIEVYRLLPRTNCAECGEPNCMAFATRLVNRELTLEACPPLLRPEYAGDLGELEALLAPPVRAVRIGDGPTAVTVGGKYVVQRHEFTYHHPTACAMAVDDALSPDRLAERVRTAADFSYNYIGRDLRLDAIAVRSATGDPDRFREAVGAVAATCDLPLLLCSLDPGVLRAGLEAAPGRRPLLYAADRTNWREMAELALEARCPLAVSAPDDLAGLRSLTKTLRAWGLDDLVLDPGTFPGPGLPHTLRNFARCRYAAIRGGDDLLGYPLLGAPLAAFTGEELDPVRCAFDEAVTASALLSRYADLLILHGLEGWSVLPTLLWRFNIYTDPRKPVAVEPGLREFGTPDRQSPVLVTANYALDLLHGRVGHQVREPLVLPRGGGHGRALGRERGRGPVLLGGRDRRGAHGLGGRGPRGPPGARDPRARGAPLGRGGRGHRVAGPRGAEGLLGSRRVPEGALAAGTGLNPGPWTLPRSRS